MVKAFSKIMPQASLYNGQTLSRRLYGMFIAHVRYVHARRSVEVTVTEIQLAFFISKLVFSRYILITRAAVFQAKFVKQPDDNAKWSL